MYVAFPLVALMAWTASGQNIVKVLSFVGEGAGIDDVDNQHMCFEKDLIPGVAIKGTKSATITAETLQGYDVVLMPGGSSFYTNQPDVDVEAIRAFVKSGGGYYGTCAGAYGGCTSINADPATGVINPYTGRKVVAVRNDTNGMPVYPQEAGIGVSRANCHMFYQVGKTQNKMTAAGTKVFDLSGDVPIDHHNGPAMDGGGIAAAIFDDTSERGMNSIVLDTYGSGRSILISPHPEHDYLQNCAIVARAAAYAAGRIGSTTEFEHIAVAVNAANAGWTADPLASGRFKSLSNVRAILGTWTKGHPKWSDTRLPEYNATDKLAAAVPAEFDPRTKWPKCTVIGKVRNQAGCGSCWAFGATESFESARCIATGQDIEFSADDTAACSSFGNGCDGGQPSAANQWFASTGVVTGGEYGTNDGCLPYVCPPCEHGLYPPACPEGQCSPLLRCTRTCSNSGYPKSYGEDKTRAMEAFSVRSISQMQQVLSTSGPLSVAFSVYADFPTYTSGVYSHTSGGMLGGHAVVMLGWGTENGRKYWLIKNSWTAKWGDKGFFKIARGVDECGIEDDVSGTRFNSVAVVV